MMTMPGGVQSNIKFNFNLKIVFYLSGIKTLMEHLWRRSVQHFQPRCIFLIITNKYFSMN